MSDRGENRLFDHGGAQSGNSSPFVRTRIVVEGRVQGVWFRASTKRAASTLGVTGYVRNLEDGCVEVVAEGSEEAVQRLVGWCRTGPPNALVLNVTDKRETYTGEFDAFDVVYR